MSALDKLKSAFNKTPTGALGRDVSGVLGQVSHNKNLQEFGAKLGFGKSDAQKAAEEQLQKAQQSYENLNPPELAQENPVIAKAIDEGPSAYGGISLNPQAREAQLAQMAALQNLAANGGRNAASDADLAQIQQSANAAAQGQRGAIMQNANARGMGGSGASLLAQLNSAQNQMNNQSMQDLQVRGQDQSNALQAGLGASNIGANMQNMDFNQQAQKAAANDAVTRFNAANQNAMNQYNSGVQNQAQQYNTGLQQTGYQNEFQKQAAKSGSSLAGVNYNQAQANMGAQQAGNILGAGIKVGTAVAGAPPTPAATGGRIPGMAAVPGNSMANDSVHIMASPGEVVVPRTLAMHGTTPQIGNFVKHPPQVRAPGSQNKEAMLSALKNLRRRGM